MKPIRWANLILLSGMMLGLGGCYPKPPPAPVERPQSPAFGYYYRALEAIEKEQFDTALALVDSAIALKPGYVNFYFVKAKLFEWLHQPDSAIVAYRQCVRLKSHFPAVWKRLGRLLLAQQAYPEAAFFLEKTVNAFPDSLHYLLLLGQASVGSEKYALALDFLKQYLERAVEPEPPVFYWLGRSYYGLGRDAKAVEALRRYLQMDASNPQAMKYLGLALVRLGKSNEGISYLNRALQQLPLDVDILLARIRFFLETQKWVAAKTQLDLALQAYPDHPALLLEQARYHFLTQQLKASRQVLEQLLAKRPDFWTARRLLGQVLEAQGEVEEALNQYQAYLEHTLKLDPEIERRVNELRSRIAK